MPKQKKDTIEAKGFSIQIYTEDFKNDYISLTDIARYKNTDDPRFVVLCQDLVQIKMRGSTG